MICIKCGCSQQTSKREFCKIIKDIVDAEVCKECGNDVFLDNGKTKSVSNFVGKQIIK